MMLLALLILAVFRMHLIEPSRWPGLPQVSHSSVDRASDRFTEGHKFDSCRELIFFSLFHAHDIICSKVLTSEVKRFCSRAV